MAKDEEFLSGSSSSKVHISGSTFTVPAGSISYPTTTGTWGAAATSPPPRKTVQMPNRTTHKVLVAFLDEDDEAVWAKKLVPLSMDLSWDGSEPPRLTLELSLEDIYKNEP